jgi:hypothetical protein
LDKIGSNSNPKEEFFSVPNPHFSEDQFASLLMNGSSNQPNQSDREATPICVYSSMLSLPLRLSRDSYLDESPTIKKGELFFDGKKS